MNAFVCLDMGHTDYSQYPDPCLAETPAKLVTLEELIEENNKEIKDANK
jgi:hypothetical protein